MEVLRFVPRLLLAQNKLAPMAITRMYGRKKEMKKHKEPVLCFMSVRRSEFRCNNPRLKNPAPECLADPCDYAPPPMDLDHYTPSDKKKRKYQRTWCECHPLPKKSVQKKKCFPERPRRKLKNLRTKLEKCYFEKKDTSRAKPPKLVELQRMPPWPCCKITAPGCKQGRRPPSCDAGRIGLCCKKRRTQYPSFSECIPIGLLDPIPPCECEKSANMCDVWAYWRRMHE